MAPRIVFLAGLPRSGSTLVSNLLGAHPAIRATPSSPLYALVEKIRAAWSHDEMLLAQLDADFDGVYARLRRSTRAFMDAWSADTDQPLVLDKHRGWLSAIETLHELYPDFQMIVCLRDLRDVYGSIERQHRRTLLLTFPDGTEQNLVDQRVAQLFAPTGVIGGPLRALRNLGHVPWLLPHVTFVRYEWLMERPTMLDDVTRWIGLEPHHIDLQQIRQHTHEADSYYRFKYPHRLRPRLEEASQPSDHLSPRVLHEIVSRFGWYYRAFYQRAGVDVSALTEPSEGEVVAPSATQSLTIPPGGDLRR